MKKAHMLPSRFWRYMSIFWTIAMFATVILDFVDQNRFEAALGPVAAVYIAVLSIFSADKEFERWSKYYESRHPGEIYVILWTVLIGGVFFLDFAFDLPYKMPAEVFSTYIVVLGILAITRKSRELFQGKEKNETHQN